MNIGIDISQTAYAGTGVARFMRGLTLEILRHTHDHTWTFFYSSLRTPIEDSLAHNIRECGYKLITAPIPPSILSYMWNTAHILPVETFVGHLDWFITSDWTEPPSQIKKATIIHDLTVFKHQDTVHPKIMSTQLKRLRHVEKESKLIFADSQATADDVSQFLPNACGKVATVYPGVSVKYPTSEELTIAQQKFAISKPFILTVGKTEPRKNIPRLIQAFNLVNDGTYELIIAGPKGWDTEITSQDLSHTRVVGMLSESELHSLYELCSFFAYPSLWEGFGYPVVEAMLHQKAVLTSQTSSLVEVAKQGALLCNPESVSSISDALRVLMFNTDKRKELSDAGRIFAANFTWHNYYKTFISALSSYENSN